MPAKSKGWATRPSSATGRMEAAAKFFMRSLERANVIPGKGGKS
ncbi:MAG: hypothetical protein ACXVK3_13780 [Candidatus Angelobacter sp.]